MISRLGTAILRMLKSTVPEINDSLSVIRTSECHFIRNGLTHIGVRAECHIQRKYDHLKKRIERTKAFIEHAATRNTISGLMYRPFARNIHAKAWRIKEGRFD